ncbi:MAG: hypothetical protein QNJ27_03660 [Simkaniaceae bacterium]|nr:hypothetical protein [Simkaniaceae bacterium]
MSSKHRRRYEKTFSFFCGALQVQETAPSLSELSTIHTYGGGKFFKTIFDAVHILVFERAKHAETFNHAIKRSLNQNI